MRIKLWPEDTIARRFALTIVLAIVVALSLTGLVIQFSGVWGLPPANELGLLERANDIVRMVEAVPEQERPVLTGVAANATFHVDWYSATAPVAVMLEATTNLNRPRNLAGFDADGRHRRVFHFTSESQDRLIGGLHFDKLDHPNAFFLSVELRA
jgi:hypothetical protein